MSVDKVGRLQHPVREPCVIRNAVPTWNSLITGFSFDENFVGISADIFY